MRCAWDAYLNLLPIWLRQPVDKWGRDTLQQLRLRADQPPELVCTDGSRWLERKVRIEDLNYCVNMASNYSAWAADTAAQCYITAPGGHRLGICGQAVVEKGTMTAIRRISSLCIRVARDFPDLARSAAHIRGSILILGRPGSGKTTLLRDLIRQKSRTCSISVVDERQELFPAVKGGFCFPTGMRTDVLSGCTKVQGIDSVLRSMSPEYIAVDEITAEEDCRALLQASWCGVDLLASAHAEDVQDLYRRRLYKPLTESGLFQNVIVLQPDKSWRLERMEQCLSSGSVLR